MPFAVKAKFEPCLAAGGKELRPPNVSCNCAGRTRKKVLSSRSYKCQRVETKSKLGWRSDLATFKSGRKRPNLPEKTKYGTYCQTRETESRGTRLGLTGLAQQF